MNKFKLNGKGISLVEVILTVAIVAMIIPVIYSIFFVGTKSFGTSRDIGLAQQDVRNISSFINSELKNIDRLTTDVTDLSGVKFTGVYYSMEFEPDKTDDKTYYLVRKKYIDENPRNPTGKRIIANSTVDDPIYISISNTEKGKIKVKVDKTLNGQEYGVDFDIGLENGRTLDTGIGISSNGALTTGNNNKFYYSFPSDSINK